MNDEPTSDKPAALVCQAIYLLEAPDACYACRARTRMFALMALPPFTLEGDQDEVLDDDGPMLRELSALPVPLSENIRGLTADLLRPDFSRTANTRYWMNHCEHCGAKQGDFFVQGPNGPFWPYEQAQIDAIKHIKLEGPWRLPDANTAYSGAMADWRDRLHGVPPPVPKAAKSRKPRGKPTM